jgi:hypothetical protein
MPTVRRLMNKKAFEEMELLETRCKVENEKGGNIYTPILKLSTDGKEIFVILVNSSKSMAIQDAITGKSYTEVEKKFTRFVNGK